MCIQLFWDLPSSTYYFSYQMPFQQVPWIFNLGSLTTAGNFRMAIVTLNHLQNCGFTTTFFKSLGTKVLSAVFPQETLNGGRTHRGFLGPFE